MRLVLSSEITGVLTTLSLLLTVLLHIPVGHLMFKKLNWRGSHVPLDTSSIGASERLPVAQCQSRHTRTRKLYAYPSAVGSVRLTFRHSCPRREVPRHADNVTVSWNKTEGGSEKCISSSFGKLTALSNELPLSEEFTYIRQWRKC
jgi:hypothetical protein